MVRFFIVCFLVCQTHFVYAKDIHIVTSIKPIQSLISMVIDEADTVIALVDDNNSPHHFSLKPSAVQNIRTSDSVILINSNFETFMRSTLAVIPKTSHILYLSDADNITLYPTQQYGLLNDAHQTIDYHIWLSPQNAIQIIRYIASELSKINPAKQKIYDANFLIAQKKLLSLDSQLQTELAPIQNKPFMVFHNGYQYFIKTYHLNLVGIITDNPAAYSSIKRIKKAQKQLHDNKVMCVFKEPQFSSKPIEAVITNTQTLVGILDPLGANISAGKHHYFLMMRQLSKNLNTCFSKKLSA